MKRIATFLAVVLLTCAAAPATDFKSQVAPIFQQYCYRCHSEVKKSEKGKLVLDNLTRFGAKISPTGIVKPGDAAGSSFMTALTLPAKEDDHMPPAKEPQPTAAQVAIIKAWITEGASLDGKKAAVATTTPPATPPPAPATPPATPAAPAAAPGAMQSWTSADGKAIQASFLRMEGESVVIQRADGVCFLVPLTRLSPESQALAKNGGK